MYNYAERMLLCLNLSSKKIPAFILVFLLFVSVFSFTAFADEVKSVLGEFPKSALSEDGVPMTAGEEIKTGLPDKTAEKTETPVSETAPKKEYKQLLNTIEHIKYLDGSLGMFRPDDVLTRSDTARMFFNLLIDNKVPVIEVFSDLRDSDCYNEANALAGLGIFNGYSGDDKFYPENPISRAEFVTVLARFFDTDGYIPEKSYFSDVPNGFWCEKVVAYAVESGFINGHDDGAFLPDGNITRAETAVIMNRVLGRICDREAAYGKNIRVFIDVPVDYWAFFDIMEASIQHEYIHNGNGEVWTDWDNETLGLPRGYYSYGAELFYVTEDGVFMRGDGYEGHFFDMSGRYISWNDELDVILKDIINSCTTPDMTRYQKRETLYKYIRDNYNYLKRPLVDKYAQGWELDYALKFFESGVGNCYSFAAGYGLLIKRVGYNVNFIVGTVGTNNSPHGWVEVVTDGEIRNDDVELDMSYRRKGNYGYTLFDFPYSKSPFIYRK
jgi:hypothetical protein